MYNLSLLKSIAIFDQTSAVKLTYVYELPRRTREEILVDGRGGRDCGGWRISGIQTYAKRIADEHRH